MAAVALGLAVPGLAAAQDGFPGPGPRGSPGAMFDRVDADGDGQVTVKEVEAFRAELFRQMDADGDGEMTPDEAMAFGSGRLGARVDQRMQRLDTDGSGTVSVQDYELGRTGALFERLDANGDGVITRDEIPERGHGPRRG